MKTEHLKYFLSLSVMLLLFHPAVSAQEGDENPLPHFLFPEFREGVVVMKTGETFSTLLNYNMLEQMMVTHLNGIYRYSRDPDLIDTIYIGDRIFIPIGGIFYELLSAGPVNFYIQNKSTFLPKGSDVGYGVNSRSTGPTKYSRFELNNFHGKVAYIDIPPNGEIRPASLFWVEKNGQFEKFSNDRQCLKLFRDYENELRLFMDREKIDFNSPEGVRKLADYCNKILNHKD
ncbi:MAG: hypothetical protein P1P83_07965 [Bacteroidales bacterium]|nr:hypothetical protein [Bacteroidales bacterium]MDT8373538.1 hypothetical protein [Bacteroidales bacterium]